MTIFGKTGLLALALVLPVAGCGNGGQSDEAPDDAGGRPPAAVDFTFVATEFKFEPADLMVPADTTVTVSLENGGVVEHDWTVDDLDVHIPVNPGETAEAEFSAPAGTYEIYCSVPGHKEVGMVGTLIAE